MRARDCIHRHRLRSARAQVKGVADAGAASLRVSGLELGGLFGSLLAGKLSDMLIKSSAPGVGHVGKRIQVVIGYTLGIAAMLMAFAATPASLGWLQWVTVFMIGFFLYGPQVGGRAGGGGVVVLGVGGHGQPPAVGVGSRGSVGGSGAGGGAGEGRRMRLDAQSRRPQSRPLIGPARCGSHPWRARR